MAGDGFEMFNEGQEVWWGAAGSLPEGLPHAGPWTVVAVDPARPQTEAEHLISELRLQSLGERAEMPVRPYSAWVGGHPQILELSDGKQVVSASGAGFTSRPPVGVKHEVGDYVRYTTAGMEGWIVEIDPPVGVLLGGQAKVQWKKPEEAKGYVSEWLPLSTLSVC